MTDSQRSILYRAVFLTVLLLLVYGNTLNHGFVWDDTDIIVDNPVLEKLTNIPTFFLSEDKIETASGYYRPMTYVSFALDRAIWGLNPVGFNITNLALHIGVTLLFLLVARQIFMNDRLAFVAALLFSLHPLVGETVNFHAGGRNTLLCAFFFLFSFLLHTKKKPLPAVLCFAVAIFSKEFGLLLPPILYVYDRFLKNEKRRLISYAPFLIPIICYFILRSYAVQNANIFAALSSDSLWVAPYLIVRYLINMIYPFGLKVLYDVHTNIYIAALCLVGTITLIAMMCYSLKKRPSLALSIFWFLLFLLPVINIIPLPAASFMADRYAYFPLMGFCLALASIICNTNKRVVTPIVLVLCAVFSLIDFRRNGNWKNDFSFYTQMTKDAPEMALGYHDLGIYYFKHDDLAKAETYLTMASSKQDITPRLLGAGAGALWESGKVDSAEKLLLRQLQLDPANPQPYIMLKMIYERKGNLSLAKTYGDKAEALFPGIERMMADRAAAVTQQAESFMAQRLHSRATTMLLEALAINPDYIPALIDMGSIYAETGALEKSLRYLKRAASLDPLNPSAHYNLSMVYQMQGKSVEAEAEMKKFNETEAVSKQHEHEMRQQTKPRANAVPPRSGNSQ